MRRAGVIVSLLAGSACGRINFDPQVDATPLTICVPATRLSSSGGRGQPPDIAWTGAERAIIWHDARDDGVFDTWFASIDATGAITTAKIASTPVGPQSFAPWSTAIASSGTVYGISWVDGSGDGSVTYFATIDRSGALRSGPTQVDSRFSGQPSLVWNGVEFALAWAANTSSPPTPTSPSHIYLQRYSETGSAVGGPAQISDDNSLVIYPTLAWTGDGYLVTWLDGRDGARTTYLGAADVNGIKRGPDRRIGTSQGGAGIAWNGTTALVAHGGPSGEPGLVLSTHDRVGAQISSRTFPEIDVVDPAVTWGGTEWDVVAITRIPAKLTVDRFTRSLTPLGSVQVWDGTVQYMPRIRWTGDRLLVGFADWSVYPFETYLLELCP